MIIAFSARSEGLKPLEIAEREYCTSNTIHGLGDGDVNTCLDLYKYVWVMSRDDIGMMAG